VLFNSGAEALSGAGNVCLPLLQPKDELRGYDEQLAATSQAFIVA